MLQLLREYGVVGGSRFGYHWFIERGEAGPFFGIKWVPSTVLKTEGEQARRTS